MTAIAASRAGLESFTARIGAAHAAAAEFAECRMIEATYRDDTATADRWALTMARADDQALLLDALCSGRILAASEGS